MSLNDHPHFVRRVGRAWVCVVGFNVTLPNGGSKSRERQFAASTPEDAKADAEAWVAANLREAAEGGKGGGE